MDRYAARVIVSPSRWSNSSVSAYCSNGSPAGCATKSATSAAARPGSSVAPTRAAGADITCSSSAGPSGASENDPASTNAPSTGWDSGRSYRSARTVATTRTRLSADIVAATRASRNRSRTTGFAIVHNSSNWSRTSTTSSTPAGSTDAMAGPIRAGSSNAATSPRRCLTAIWASASATSSDGCPPGTATTAKRPSRRIRGRRPARTNELFPDPEAPTTTTNRRSDTSATSRSSDSARPWKSWASPASNARRPL